MPYDEGQSRPCPVQKLQPSQLPDVPRLKTNLIWYGAGCLVLGVGLVGLLGLGGYIFARWRAGAFGAAGAAPREAHWDGRTRLRCAGNEQIMVRGVTAVLPSGAAIVATDNCVLTMEDVNVTAPIALQAQGNARVTVYRGSLHGSEVALVAMGTARVTLWGTTINGGTNIAAPASLLVVP